MNEFKDHVVQNPDKFIVTDNPDGTKTIKPFWVENPTDILQAGTPFNAAAFNAIPAEIAAIDEKVTSQLADTAKQVVKNEDYNKKGLPNVDSVNFYSGDAEEPIITFIDDDGRSEVHSRLFPIFQAKGVPFVAAICTDYIGMANYMTPAQVKEIHDNGHEIINHNSEHGAYNELAPLEWERQIKKGREDLYTLGYTHDVFVYPKGQSDPGFAITRKYAKCAFDNVGQNPPGALPTYGIKRIPYGSWFEDSDTHDFAYYKNIVDSCVSQKTWLVFMVHVYAQDAEQDAILSQLIDYIKGLNVKILNASDAYALRANRLEINNQPLINAKGEFVADYDGQNNILLTTPIASYKRGVSVRTIGTSYAATNGFPENIGGSLITYRQQSEDIYNYQEYQPYQRSTKYVRFWTGSSWTAFSMYSDRTIISFTDYTNSTPLSNFKTGYKTYRVMSNAAMAASGFPFTTASLLIVDRIDSNAGTAKQELRPLGKEYQFVRYATGTDTWGEWIFEGTIFGGTDGIDNSTPASSFRNLAVTYHRFSSATMATSGFPVTTGAIIITDRTFGFSGYDKQTLRPIASNDEYTRVTDGSGNWLGWSKVAKTNI